jgi:hypothetical protein
MDDESDLPRRDFHQLALSAMAGVMAGLATPQASAQPIPQPLSQQVPPAAPQPQPVQRLPRRAAGKTKPKDESNPLLFEPHVCRGLNTCKGLGVDQQNACAGRGSCATAPHHECAGHNDCRGLGACNQGDPNMGQEPDSPGENTCKGHGGCQVPLKIATDAKHRQLWDHARLRFKALMKDVHGIDIGKPPPPPR